MSFDPETLYSLLPAVYRRIYGLECSQRTSLGPDTGADQPELPLHALLQVIAEQIGVLEENLAQLYDDQFIETCAEWVIPYIGDLVGYATPRRIPTHSQRSEVANTISYRRRKGTALLIEQLVQDVTGWDTHIIEYAQLLATTQHLAHPHRIQIGCGDPRGRQTATDHPYPKNCLVDLREQEDLRDLGTPFERIVHMADMRNSTFGRGGYNIPNIGVFLWRLTAYPMTLAPAVRAFPNDSYRYLFSPLGDPLHLFSLASRSSGQAHSLGGHRQVSMPLSRALLARNLANYYGKRKSLLLTTITANNKQVDFPVQNITISDLSDHTDSQGDPTWSNLPTQHIAIDPVLGRIAFPCNEAAPAHGTIYTTFHYGFSADIGGGEYQRASSFSTKLQTTVRVAERCEQYTYIQNAVDALQSLSQTDGGVVEIIDCGHYKVPAIKVTGKQCIELRAADFRSPLLIPDGSAGVAEMQISGEEDCEVILNGLLISGGLRVQGHMGRLTLRHCTLVPGLSLSREGEPEHPQEASLVVQSAHTRVEIDHCIVGRLHIDATAQVHITNSIVDATSSDGVAYTGSSSTNARLGGHLSVKNSTIIGRVQTVSLELASNTIFLANFGPKGGEPVHVEKRQEGLMRYSYIPDGSCTPPRYRCQPSHEGGAEQVKPLFTSLHYGNPGYCQLLQRTSPSIRQGADDESEMGAFHDLLQPQREANLHARFKEYLSFTVEPALIYMT